MRKICASVMLLMLILALASTGFATDSKELVPFTGNASEEVWNSLPRWEGGLTPTSELDDYMGDTVVVGYSALDNQHNVIIGRTIVYDPNGNGGNGVAALIFTDLSLNGATRGVKLNRVTYNGDTPEVGFPAGWALSTGTRGGYATIGMAQNMDSPVVMPAYHDRAASGQPYSIRAAGELAMIPGVFNEYTVPMENGFSMVQPKIATDGDSIAHIVHGNTGDGVEKFIFYDRLAYNRNANEYTITNPDNLPEEVVDNAGLSNAAIAISPDGERVVITKQYDRYDLGLIEEPFTFDSDLIYWSNDNRGLDWEFGTENAINLTSFIGPDPTLLPDTVAADQDTMRQDYESSAMIDADHTLHIVFAANPYYHYEGGGTVLTKLYYWNDVDNQFVMIADGDFWLNARPPAWDGMVGHPSLYKDEETGYLWCLYQQYGVPGDTLDDGTPRDAGESSGRLNAELFVTASPPGEFNGKLWFKGVNITNSRGETGNLAVGDSRSERDASLALNNDGDYLNIIYLLDLDAGDTDNQEPEGTVTDNPIVYNRILKSELLEAFDDQQEFVRNYPLHINGVGYWEDPQDWEWRDVSAPEQSNGNRPEKFRISKVYPNPFNATTRISFEIPSPDFVILKVFDILGREVATLAQRNLQAGHHQVLFTGESLASGVYFVELQGTTGRHIQKIALMK